MAGLAGHELLAGGCLPRCALRLPPKRGREPDAEATENTAEAHAPRAKRLQRATQMMAQLDAFNLAPAAAQPPHAAFPEPLPVSPVAAPTLAVAAPAPAAPCNALAVWSPLACLPAAQCSAPAAPPCDEMDDAAPQEPPSGAHGGLRLPAVDVLLRPGGLALAPPRPQASAGALVVWAGQPNISSVVARAAARCGLLPPPRAPSTPLPAASEDDDAPPPAPQRAAPLPADAPMAYGDEVSQEASQASQDAMMALD